MKLMVCGSMLTVASNGVLVPSCTYSRGNVPLTKFPESNEIFKLKSVVDSVASPVKVNVPVLPSSLTVNTDVNPSKSSIVGLLPCANSSLLSVNTILPSTVPLLSELSCNVFTTVTEDLSSNVMGKV